MEKRNKDKEKNWRIVALDAAAASLLVLLLEKWRIGLKKVFQLKTVSGSRSTSESLPPPEKHMAVGPTLAIDKDSRLCKYQLDFLKYDFSCTTKNKTVCHLL